MYLLQEVFLILRDWLNERRALRNALLATATILLLTVTWNFVRWLASDEPSRFGVSGRVTLAAAPLETGTIEFRAATKGGSAGGAVIRDGRYRIPGNRGLPAGEYLVRIYSATLPMQPPESGPPGGGVPLLGTERIPPEFGSDTKQRVSIGRGSRNVFDFDIPAPIEHRTASGAQ